MCPARLRRGSIVSCRLVPVQRTAFACKKRDPAMLCKSPLLYLLRDHYHRQHDHEGSCLFKTLFLEMTSSNQPRFMSLNRNWYLSRGLHSFLLQHGPWQPNVQPRCWTRFCLFFLLAFAFAWNWAKAWTLQTQHKDHEAFGCMCSTGSKTASPSSSNSLSTLWDWASWQTCMTMVVNMNVHKKNQTKVSHKPKFMGSSVLCAAWDLQKDWWEAWMIQCIHH